MAELEMTKWKSKRCDCGILPNPIVGHLFPTDCWQTNIRPVQIGEQRAVSDRFPAEKISKTGSPRVHGATTCLYPVDRLTSPRRAHPFIEASCATNFLIELYKVKI